MGRVARVVAPGFPHHVTQRGNRRMQTFFDDDDYRAYLSLLRRWCDKHDVRIWAYCLMPNHVHLIVVPSSADGLWRGIGEAHRRYTRRVNLREGWRGHLWQDRFTSYVMDDSYLLAAARYVERNPVKAGLAASPADWPWSSAAAHVASRSDAVAEGDWLAERIAGWVCTWGEYLRDWDEPDVASRLARHERTGRPLGQEGIVERVGALLSRDLLPKKRGPKPKKNN